MDRITDAPVPVTTSKVTKILPANNAVPVNPFHSPRADTERRQIKAEKKFRKRLLAHVAQMNPVVAGRGWRFCLRRLPDVGVPYGALVVDCLDTADIAADIPLDITADIKNCIVVRQMSLDEFLALTPDTIMQGGFFVNEQC